MVCSAYITSRSPTAELSVKRSAMNSLPFANVKTHTRNPGLNASLAAHYCATGRGNTDS